MAGNKARRRESKTEREREREGGRATRLREKMVWVDFDCLSKSPSPEKFLKASIN